MWALLRDREHEKVVCFLLGLVELCTNKLLQVCSALTVQLFILNEKMAK